MCPTCSASHEGDSGRGWQTQDFHIKKPILLLLWCTFLLESKTRKTVLTELHGKFCRPSALLSSAFGRVELRTLIINSRDQKGWERGHLLQETLGECGSSSSLFLQCHLPHLSQGSKLRSSRWHVWMDFDHLEIVCYLPAPCSKLHLWLHFVKKSLLLWPQTSAMALPFPSWAFSVTRTVCITSYSGKYWQESPLS